MNVIEIVAYKCSKCGAAYQSRKHAEKCCMPKICEDCGCEIPHNSYYVVCDSCRSKREAVKEKERFNKAKHYTFEDAPESSYQCMYSEVYGTNEGYFFDLDELEEYCQENDIEIPEYVWGTKLTKISMDADSIIESACEELHEDAEDQIDDREELQEILDKWCEKQSGTDTYYVDYSVAILINKSSDIILTSDDVKQMLKDSGTI